MKKKSTSKIKRKISKRPNPPRKSKPKEKTPEDLETIGFGLQLMVGSLVEIQLWPTELFKIVGILQIDRSEGWIGEKMFYCNFQGPNNQFVKVIFNPGDVDEFGKSSKGNNYVMLRA